MIKVYHVIEPTFFLTEQAPLRKSALALVAEVQTDIPGEAYELTNTIHGPWWKNGKVRFLGSPQHGMDGCRSTSVGDVLELADGTYQGVAGLGFREVTVIE